MVVWITLCFADTTLTKFHNKAFKSDSQRLAFFILSLGFVFTVAWFRLGGSVAHTLMRRYVSFAIDRMLFLKYKRPPFMKVVL